MQYNLKSLHFQINFWKPHGRTLLCWAFYCENDNTNVDLENPLIMHCILCHKNLVDATNPRTQRKRRLISHFKKNGIISLKKHVDVDHHGPIVKIFEEEVNNLLKRKKKKKATIRKEVKFDGKFDLQFF
jgi:hypothetical protein